MKWIKWLAFLLVLILTIVIGLLYLLEPQINGAPSITKEIFADVRLDYEEHNIIDNGQDIRWIETGHFDSKKLIFFFHGAPGSWADFSSIMTDSILNDDIHMISMDRPGYGKSGYGKFQKSISTQVNNAHAIMAHYPEKEIYLVGYSYGAPIAATYASRFPQQVKSLLLLAPVIHPDHEKIFWFNHILKLGIVKWILPKFITVANDEKLSHSSSLDQTRNDWNKINVPTTHMHCSDDWIAPMVENVAWSKSHIDAQLIQYIIWDGDSHFYPNRIPEKILPEIRKYTSQ